MSTGTCVGPVGRDWLPTPSSERPVVVLPYPRPPRRAAAPGVVAVPLPRQARHDRLPEPEPPRQLTRRLVLGTLLNVAALVGMAMTSLTVYAATHHLRPLVVRSGSMEPLIRTGGMVLVQSIPASQIRVGDVVAAKRPDGVTVTHRVVSLSRNGDLAQLVLKGDANKTVDPEPVPVARVGRLVWSAPLLGRIAAWTASARGGFVLGCVVTAALLSLRRRSP